MTIQPSFIAVALLAVLVGAMIPVLYQAYQTFKRARALLDDATPRLVRTLDQMGEAAERLNRVSATLESRMLAPLLGTGIAVARSIQKSRELLQRFTAFGGALGPAVLAGVRALFHRPGIRPLRREF